MKARHVSGDAFSANICPKENWTVQIVSRSSLLSHVAFQVVGSPIFFQGKADGPPLPWHGVTPPHPASCQCIPWGNSMEKIPSSAFLQPAHCPGLCSCGATGEASRHRGKRNHVLTLPVAWASSSSHEEQQRKADVYTGDLNMSGGNAPSKCWPKGLSVWEISKCTHKGMVLRFIMVLVDLPAAVLQTLAPASWVSKQPGRCSPELLKQGWWGGLLPSSISVYHQRLGVPQDNCPKPRCHIPMEV